MITLFGEVSEVDVFEVRMGNLGEELCALLVGEMSLTTQDALFVHHRTGRGVDHRRFVVGFDVKVVALFEVGFDEGCDEAEVGAEAEFEARSAYRKCNWIEGVVLDGERVDFEVAKFKRFAGGEDFKAGRCVECF